MKMKRFDKPTEAYPYECVCVYRPSSWAQGVTPKRVLGFRILHVLQGARKGGEGVLANEDTPPQPCEAVPAF